MNNGTLSEIRMFAGPFNPEADSMKDWKLCNGEVLPIHGNEVLFGLLSNHFGGDGKNNFALPNLTGRITVGSGYDHEGIPEAYRIGKVFGNESVTLKAMQLPSHSHSGSLDVELPVLNKMGTKGIPNSNYLATIPPEKMYSDNANTSLKAFQVPVAVEMSKLEEDFPAPIDVRQSYQVINFLICVHGLYPHRPE